MEYKRVENSEEIVLTYCPAKQVDAVELRYERDLPERMRAREQEKASCVDESVSAREANRANTVSELTEPKHGKRRSWITLSAILLSFVLIVGGIGFGIWGIVDTAADFFFAVRLPQTPPGDSDDNENGGSNAGGKDNLPNIDRNETVVKDGAPQIDAYRPPAGTSGLNLISAAPDRKILTPGEIYDKVAPSTVTIIGIHGETYSVGTGVIFTSDGYIITNYHVIAGCLDCEVWVTNEYGVDSTYPARFVGGDDDKDLAILKIEAQDLPAAEFGVSSDLSVGDKVYAIGNPLGTELRSTFTDGIISAVDRNVDVDGVTMTLLQTNTALNSGNSGGPLINVYGQVIGINTIKMMSGYDTIEGLGFAIPTSLAERWVNDIITTGEVRPTPILGISVNRIPVRLEDGTVGLEVLDVTKGLGADCAGVQVGDVVVAFNGAPVSNVDDIYDERIKLSVGDVVVVRVWRSGEYLDITMVMMAEPD